MLAVLVGAVATLIGVLLGGAIRAREAARERRMDADALLSALVAEVEAITRLIDHRQFIPAMLATQESARIKIQTGQGSDPTDFITVSLKQNYFATYEASLPKIGLLDPYWADRITRFYTFTKAVTENYSPDSPFSQVPLSAHLVDEIMTNDLMLLHTVVVLGHHISSQSRTIVPPPGMIDPFGPAAEEGSQPPLPQPFPELANREAQDSAFNPLQGAVVAPVHETRREG